MSTVNGHLSLVNCHLLTFTSYLSTVTCQLELVNSLLLIVTCQFSTVYCQLSNVNGQLSLVKCHLSLVISELLTVTCHFALVSCHMYCYCHLQWSRPTLKPDRSACARKSRCFGRLRIGARPGKRARVQERERDAGQEEGGGRAASRADNSSRCLPRRSRTRTQRPATARSPPRFSVLSGFDRLVTPRM